jgi:amino acid transporter
MYSFFCKAKKFLLTASISVLSLSAWAVLPAPPDQLNIKDGNYAEGLISYGLTIMGYGCYLLAGLAFLFVGYEMVSAYQEAKKLEKLSHFFTWALVGVFTLAVCLGLLYAGNILMEGAPKPSS